jgi:hypothetical protein
MSGPDSEEQMFRSQHQVTPYRRCEMRSSPSAASLTDFFLSAGASACSPASPAAPVVCARAVAAPAPSTRSRSSSSTSSFVLPSTTIGRRTMKRTCEAGQGGTFSTCLSNAVCVLVAAQCGPCTCDLLLEWCMGNHTPHIRSHCRVDRCRLANVSFRTGVLPSHRYPDPTGVLGKHCGSNWMLPRHAAHRC